MNESPFSLGGNAREKKGTDYHPDNINLGSVSPTPISYTTPISTIYSQLKIPACGAHMEAGMISTLFGVIASPEMAWDEIKLIDDFPPEDGTSFPAIMKEAQNTSICDLTLLANHTDQSLLQYTDPSKITSAMLLNASPRKITGYSYIDNPTFQQIKDQIFKNKVVGLLVDCGDGWWVNGYAEKDTCPLKVGNFVGHHFIYANGFDEKYIYFVNSWDTIWGRNGTGYFDASYVPHILEMGIMNVGGKYIFNNNLFFGMTNNADVHALQVRLGVTPATGNFGPITLSAVRAYQKANGLPQTGFVWTLTRAKLNS